MAIKGSGSTKNFFNNILSYKFKKVSINSMIVDFNDSFNDTCYNYFSKEYFADDKMRIGIIKQ